MTYRLNPEISKIVSSVVLVFPDGTKKSFLSGAAVAEDVFNERYKIKTVRAVENTVEITLSPIPVAPINPIGEETFF